MRKETEARLIKFIEFVETQRAEAKTHEEIMAVEASGYTIIKKIITEEQEDEKNSI